MAQLSVSACQLIKLIKSVSSLVFKKVTTMVCVFLPTNNGPRGNNPRNWIYKNSQQIWKNNKQQTWKPRNLNWHHNNSPHFAQSVQQYCNNFGHLISMLVSTTTNLHTSLAIQPVFQRPFCACAAVPATTDPDDIHEPKATIMDTPI